MAKTCHVDKNQILSLGQEAVGMQIEINGKHYDGNVEQDKHKVHDDLICCFLFVWTGTQSRTSLHLHEVRRIQGHTLRHQREDVKLREIVVDEGRHSHREQ